jgi:phosphoenolpyruvate carboxykinase (ATP)
MSKYLKFDTPATAQAADLASRFGLDNHGLRDLDRVFWNLPEGALYEEATFRKEGKVTHGGALVVNTGKWSARAAQDKYVVREASTEDQVWWGEYNRPFDPEKFEALFSRVQAFLQDEEVFVQDCYAGADPEYRMPVRIITEDAWQSLFARNMFILPDNQDAYQSHVPDFTVIAVPSFKTDPRVDGTRTDTAIIINFAKRLVLICNSSYGGEIKKSIFTVMNFLLPLQRTCWPCTARPMSATMATRPCSSACRAPARPRCRRIPTASSSATTNTAGPTRASSTSRAVATPR